MHGYFRKFGWERAIFVGRRVFFEPFGCLSKRILLAFTYKERAKIKRKHSGQGVIAKMAVWKTKDP
jgi:hypothetical protein